MTDGVLTTCYGPVPYRRLAANLARSLARHAPDTPRALATDAPQAPEFAGLFDEVVPLRPEFGGAFLQKLHLDAYSPFDRTLYIDSDCLVCEPLEPVWAAFRDRPFGVCGFNFSWNHWFHPQTLPPERRRYGYPIFNGGLFYFEREGAEVFADARSMVDSYDAWQIGRIAGVLNDEPLIAIAMACRDLSAVVDEGRIMRTLAGIEGPLHLDVLRGGARFVKYEQEVRPAIVHFAAGSWRMGVYRREARRLMLAGKRVPVPVLSAMRVASDASRWVTEPLRRRIPTAPRASLAVQEAARTNL